MLRHLLATVLLAGGMALVSGSASAQAIPSPAAGEARPMPSAAAAGLEEKDRIVCRSQRHTGSRFPVRTCMTKSEWRAQTEAAQAQSDKIKERTKATLQRKPLSL